MSLLTPCLAILSGVPAPCREGRGASREASWRWRLRRAAPAHLRPEPLRMRAESRCLQWTSGGVCSSSLSHILYILLPTFRRRRAHRLQALCQTSCISCRQVRNLMLRAKRRLLCSHSLCYILYILSPTFGTAWSVAKQPEDTLHPLPPSSIFPSPAARSSLGVLIGYFWHAANSFFR